MSVLFHAAFFFVKNTPKLLKLNDKVPVLALCGCVRSSPSNPHSCRRQSCKRRPRFPPADLHLGFFRLFNHRYTNRYFSLEYNKYKLAVEFQIEYLEIKKSLVLWIYILNLWYSFPNEYLYIFDFWLKLPENLHFSAIFWSQIVV